MVDGLTGKVGPLVIIRHQVGTGQQVGIEIAPDPNQCIKD